MTEVPAGGWESDLAPALPSIEAGPVMVAFERLERAVRAVQERSWPFPPSVEAALRMLDDARRDEARHDRR